MAEKQKFMKDRQNQLKASVEDILETMLPKAVKK